jgi:hypothetical protein
MTKIKQVIDLETALSAKLSRASNLSDLQNPVTARSNLALGTAATRNVGTASSQVAAGNHNHSALYAPVNHTHQKIELTVSPPVGPDRNGSLYLRFFKYSDFTMIDLGTDNQDVTVTLDDSAHNPGTVGFLRFKGNGSNGISFTSDFIISGLIVDPLVPALNVEVLFEMRYTEWGVLTHYWGLV